MNIIKLTLLSAVILTTTAITLCYGNSAESAEKRLYLADGIVDVMDELVTFLPFKPDGHVACYITTASKNADWAKHEINAVKEAGFEVKLVDLAELSKATVAKAFEGCDIIIGGAGHTLYLLQEVRRSGFDELVEKKIAAGVPYVGSSAGSIILAPNIECVKFADDPAGAPDLTSYEGLNLFPLVPFVHFDHPDYKVYYKKILDYALENDVAFMTVKSGQFIVVEGEKWRLVESKPK